MQERAIDGKHWLVDDLAGDGDRHGHDNAACADYHVVGADDDPVGVLGDAADGLRQVDDVAEFGGDRAVDGAHAADGSRILGGAFDAEDEAGSAC